MSSIRHILSAVALCMAVAACNGETIIGDDNGVHHLTLRNGILTAHAQGRPDATIDAAGDLRIDDKPVTVTAAQHDLLKKYYGGVVNIRKAGIETGKAGAAMAGHAIGAVAQGLAHGDPDSIGPRVDAQAKQIEVKANAICDALDSLRTTQDALAGSLPEFRPYATIDAGEVSRCRSDSKHHD